MVWTNIYPVFERVAGALTLVSLAVGPIGAAPVDRTPSAQELVDGVRGWRASIRNAHSVTLWETEFHGQVRKSAIPEGEKKPQRVSPARKGIAPAQMPSKRWSRVTLDADDLGRIRYFEENGTYTADGRRTPESTTCYVYNGEITAVFEFNYDILKGTGFGHDTLAKIYDGPFPPPRGPAGLHDPVGKCFGSLLSSWENRSEQAQVRVVPRADAGDGVFELIYEERPTAKGTVRRHHSLVDVSRGYVVLANRVTDAEERPYFSEECAYARSPDGTWLPKTGIFRNLRHTSAEMGGRTYEVPAVDIRLTCDEISVNAERVPEELFQIRLARGTHVKDARFKVQYQVGTENAIDYKLAELALKAKAEQEKDPFKAPGRRAMAEKMGVSVPSDAGRSDRFLWMGLGTLLVGLVVLLSWFSIRRSARRG